MGGPKKASPLPPLAEAWSRVFDEKATDRIHKIHHMSIAGISQTKFVFGVSIVTSLQKKGKCACYPGGQKKMGGGYL